ncbi:MAG: hypothetical protein RIS41_1730 [Actinomycetota bacterium]
MIHRSAVKKSLFASKSVRGFVAVLTGIVSTVALGGPSTRAWEGGNTAPLATLADATGLYEPEEITIHNDVMYVVNYRGRSVRAYPSNWTDLNTAPIKTLQGTATGLRWPTGIAFHNNEMYITDQGVGLSDPKVLVFAADWASGDTAPIRTLSGGATGLNRPSGIAIHDNAMYITNSDGNSVTVYSPTASGNTAPIRTLSGGATGLSKPSGIAIHDDGTGARMYITNEGDFDNYATNDSVTAYSPTASGNTAPVRTLSGFRSPRAIAFGKQNNCDFMFVAHAPPIARVDAYAANWASQVNVPTSSAKTLNANKSLLGFSNGIAVDASCQMYVTNGYWDTVTKYANNPWSNQVEQSPIRVLGQTRPDSVAVDASGRMYVLHGNSNTIKVYDSNWTSGNTTPIRTIFGPSTGLDLPTAIAVHNDVIYVVNTATYAVTVYDATKSGDAQPNKTLPLPQTATGIAFNRGEMFILGYKESLSGSVVNVYDADWTNWVTGNSNVNVRRSLNLSLPIWEQKGIAFDSNNQMYVLSSNNAGGVVDVYPANWMNPNTLPIKTLSGANNGLWTARGIAFDSKDQMYVTNNSNSSANGSVMVYAADWVGGSTAPIKTLIGTQLDNKTGIGEPYGIAFDSNDRMYVTNWTDFNVLPRSPHSVTMYGDRPSVAVPVWRATLDPNGGTCRDGSTDHTRTWTSVFVGFRYLPAATECTRPGHTFSGWARTSSPTTVANLPLLIDPSDGAKRYFTAENIDVVAVWTAQPKPPTPPQVFGVGDFFCTRCTAVWLLWPDAPDAPSDTTYTITADHSGDPIRFRFGTWNIAVFTGLTPGSTHTYSVTTTRVAETSSPANVTVVLRG